MVSVLVQLAADLTRRQLLLHRAHVCVFSVGIVTSLAVDLGLFGEEESVEVDLMDQQLLFEVLDVVDDQRLSRPISLQRPVERLVIFQVELDADFGWPVLDSNVDRHDDFGVIQHFEMVSDHVSVTF